MFSVEQVEYVRRLRSSGLTRDQTLAIWDRLDRIDAEFGQTQATTTVATSFNSSATSSPQISREFMQLLQQERTQQANALIMMQMQQLLSSTNSKSQNLSQKGCSSVTNSEKLSGENDDAKNHAVVETSLETPKKEEPTTIQQNSDPIPTRLVDENDPELVEFLRKNNEPAICEQIRQFIALNGIKQHQVAVLVGTSQSYISKYLKADYLEMSERSRRNIYRWYVTYRNQAARAISDACAVIANPQLQHSVNSSLPLTVPLSVNSSNVPILPLYPVVGAEHGNSSINGNSGNNNNAPLSPNAPGSPRSTSSSSGGNPNRVSMSNLRSHNHNWSSTVNHHSSHRRFRFTFRAQQLAILERAFAEDTYPTVERREELARELSAGLDSEQAVSLFTVTNWFANRRKEAKKAAVEEGLNVEELGMKRGRGRPSILQRIASAQQRETRQNSSRPMTHGDDEMMPTNLCSSPAKRTRKSGDADDMASDLDNESLHSGDDDHFSSDLAVFPTPEVIAN